jgi:hypothetical protein
MAHSIIDNFQGKILSYVPFNKKKTVFPYKLSNFFSNNSKISHETILNALESFAKQAMATSKPPLSASQNKDEAAKKIQFQWFKHRLSKEELKLKTVFEYWQQQNYQKVSSLPKEQKVAELFERAEKLKELYGKTHYVFVHGQSSGLYELSGFLQELYKIANPEDAKKLSKYLYAFLRFPNPQGLTAKDFFNMQKKQVNDHELFTQLLSVDADFSNTSLAESAYSFVSINYSMLFTYDDVSKFRISLCKVIKQILKTDTLPHELEQKVANYTQQLHVNVKKTINKREEGNLFVICIPKNKLQDPDTNISWRAHPNGIPCTCLGKLYDDIDELEKMQSEQTGLCCNNNPMAAQGLKLATYRLLAEELSPQMDGLRTFLLTTNSISSEKENIASEELLSYIKPYLT